MCERYISAIRIKKIMKNRYQKRHIPKNRTDEYLQSAIKKRMRYFSPQIENIQ